MDPASPTSWADGGELRKVFGSRGREDLGDEGLKAVRFPLAGGGGCGPRRRESHAGTQHGFAGRGSREHALEINSRVVRPDIPAPGFCRCTAPREGPARAALQHLIAGQSLFRAFLKKLW